MALFFVFHYLIYGYVNDTLNRQLLGFNDTLAITSVLIVYIVASAIPPFIWSRRSFYHPLWRGIESFICYIGVALILGVIFAVAEEGDWSMLSGVAAGGSIFSRIGSLVVLFAVFIFAAWWGGKSAEGRRRRRKSKGRRKKEAAIS
jgi:uncharacterized membrane protein